MILILNKLLSKSKEFDIITKTDKNIIFQGKKKPIRSYFITAYENEKLEINFQSLIKIILDNNETPELFTDLTLLKDWNLISEGKIDLLKKSYASIISPLCYFGKIPVYIRDTLLLSSAAASSLEKVGLGHKMVKVPLNYKYKSNMRLLLNENHGLFKEYAMYDSLITLIHALFMNDFSLTLGATKLPLTLGSLCSKYLQNKWLEDGYKGHQPNSEFSLGSSQITHTYKGVNSIGFAAENENLYLSSFRGGRNECFKYGVDYDTKWFDYDLASCYATIMSKNGDPFYQEEEQLDNIDPCIVSSLGDPNYNYACILHPNTDIRKFDFKNSYSAIKVKFNFPDNIKFPPLPVFMDKNITIYPLTGETIVTGPEFVAALHILENAILNMDGNGLRLREKYFIKIITGSYIPFKIDGNSNLAYKPFFSTIKELQANRAKFKKEHGKGSAMERIYKDLGNMIYGKIVCGVSNKRNFDPRTVDELGGQVTACTTDGFTCNIPDLENKILDLYKKKGIKNSLLQDYRNSRDILTNKKDPAGLEIKTSTIGLIQWSTRGQLSYNHLDPSLENYGVPINAMTGFQKFQFTYEKIKEEVLKAMSLGNKIFYLQKRLTGARDFKQVSYISALRIFRTVFDSKREIIPSINTMLDSKPWLSAKEALLTRVLLKKFSNTIYSEKYSKQVIYNTSSSSKEETLKIFIRLVLGYCDFNPSLELKIALVKYVTTFGATTKFTNRSYS
ncbi:hypothetical protein HOY82DRAFT_544367 [Tuber indicum]|nr:hypothetical protein HOY82DRAFT_544367 [Tuber indicum]